MLQVDVLLTLAVMSPVARYAALTNTSFMSACDKTRTGLICLDLALDLDWQLDLDLCLNSRLRLEPGFGLVLDLDL